MKKLLFLLVLVSGLTFSPALFAQQERKVASSIESVNVYRQRAQIQRTATVQLSEGDHRLVFSGFSQHLIPNSITVNGDGPGVIQSVKHRVTYLNQTAKPPRMLILEDSLGVLRAESQALDDEIFVYDSEQNLILENRQLKGSQTGLTATQLREMADLYRERLREIRTSSRELKREKQLIQQKINRYTQEIREMAAQREQPTQEVVIAYQTDSDASLTFTISYLVNQAGWTPFYDVRVENTESPLLFFLKANVVNQTGIDWDKVNLTLSTTQNSMSNERPKLSPWYVDFGSQPGRPVQVREMAVQAPMSNTASNTASMPRNYRPSIADGDDAREEVTAYASAFTELSENEMGLEFRISLPYDIPADGKEYQVDIQQQEIQGSYRHYAVPKMEGDVFLVAGIQQDLLRGNANVYFQGTYVGETYINTDNPRDSMLIALGRDPKVQVQREQVLEFTNRQTLGSNSVQSFGYEITLRNLRRDPVNVILIDQVPVTVNKSIKVEVLDLDGGTQDESTGLISWNLTVPPQEKQNVQLRFEVRAPKDVYIMGL